MKIILKLCGIIVIGAIMLGVANLWFSTVIVGNLWINGPVMATLATVLSFLVEGVLIWATSKLIKL